jgi:magnesium chelatase family protein
MLARVCSAAVNGIEAYPVEVEVNAGWGDTKIVIVGLPDAAVRESQDRVTTAITNSGFKFPMGRTTINLAPADVKKEGPSFDLPIAIGMLAASEQIETDQLDNFAMVGELALTGAVSPVNAGGRTGNGVQATLRWPGHPKPMPDLTGIGPKTRYHH